MGLKAFLKDKRHSDVVRKLRQFVDALTRHLLPYQTGEHLRMTLFSDLNVIAADSATIMNFRLIAKAAAALMQECHIFGSLLMAVPPAGR